MKIKKDKFHKKEIVFIVAYICFFSALFLGDVAINSNGVQIFTKMLRYVSYMLTIVQMLIHRATLKQLASEVVIWIISMLFFIFTKDIYLPMIVMLIFGSKDSSEEHLRDISLKILVIGTVLVVFACFVGIIPDIMTAKAFSNELTRHSYGFYHSNILPNNLLMIEILMAWKYKEKISAFFIMLFLILHFIVYVLSTSRMCLLVGVALTVILLVFKLNRKLRKKNRWMSFAAYCITPVCSILSIVFMFFVNTNRIVQKMDLLFSCRFSISYLKMHSTGLRLFNFISNESFFRDGLVLDNGYLFVLMRYGFIALIAINFVSYILIRKYRKDTFNLICLSCIFIIAFIDNLFLSYRFLPFLILTVIHPENARTTSKLSFDKLYFGRKK